MPKPFKLQSAKPLPAGAEIVEHEGRPHVRLKVNGRAVLYPLSKDGKKYLRPSARWYFKIRDENGQIRRIKGERDLKATEAMATAAERRAGRVRAGYSDPEEEQLRRPLIEHLAAYAEFLEAKGNVKEHNAATIAKIEAMITGCGFVFGSDVDAARVSTWLNQLRHRGRPPEIPPGVSFTARETGEILGMPIGTVRRFVSRHRLETVGTGRNRRLTRGTVLEIAERATQGIGPASVNHYIRAAKGFFKWLFKIKRIGSNPIDVIDLVSETTDIRRGRRELTADELARLFNAARESARVFRGLSGLDRFTLYLTAAGSGLRANALANLTPADFDLDPAGAVVVLPARLNKSRKQKVQPLPADVADALRGYLMGKPANEPVWGGTWHSGCAGAEMIRRDLETAGIPYSFEGPDGPLYCDFHALRHSYLTMLSRHGVDLRTAQELAGHSTPILTAKYSHRRFHDLQGAVNKLPPLVPSATAKPDETPLRMTGTDVKPAVPAVPQAVPDGDIKRHQSARLYTVYRGLKGKGKGAEIDVNP